VSGPARDQEEAHRRTVSQQCTPTPPSCLARHCGAMSARDATQIRSTRKLWGSSVHSMPFVCQTRLLLLPAAPWPLPPAAPPVPVAGQHVDMHTCDGLHARAASILGGVCMPCLPVAHACWTLHAAGCCREPEPAYWVPHAFYACRVSLSSDSVTGSQKRVCETASYDAGVVHVVPQCGACCRAPAHLNACSRLRRSCLPLPVLFAQL
jgi:hypothetical protein